jgi:hypothetical protein
MWEGMKPEFQLAWARLIARAAVDKDYLDALRKDPVTAFKELGVDVNKEIDLNKDVVPTLNDALASIRQQELLAASAVVAGATGTGSAGTPTGTFGTLSGAGLSCLGSLGSFGTIGGCAGTAGSFGSYLQGAPGMIGGSGGSATQLTSCMGSSSGAAFNCLGSAGSFGTIGGCAFTAGTFGCHLQPQTTSAQLGGGPSGGGMMCGGTTGGTAGTSSGAAFNCLGSAGSFGTIGGCAFTAGTFGCHLQSQFGIPLPGAGSSQLGGGPSGSGMMCAGRCMCDCVGCATSLPCWGGSAQQPVTGATQATGATYYGPGGSQSTASRPVATMVCSCYCYYTSSTPCTAG